MEDYALSRQSIITLATQMNKKHYHWRMVGYNNLYVVEKNVQVFCQED